MRIHSSVSSLCTHRIGDGIGRLAVTGRCERVTVPESGTGPRGNQCVETHRRKRTVTQGLGNGWQRPGSIDRRPERLESVEANAVGATKVVA